MQRGQFGAKTTICRSALLVRTVALVLCLGVVSAFVIAAVIVATALWRVAQPDPLSAWQHPGSGLVVVFFDADEETTMPRAEAGLRIAGLLEIETVFLVGGARPERDYYGSARLAERLADRAESIGLILIADRSSFDTVSNLESVARFKRGQSPDATLVLVSDDYHLMRISWLVRRGPLAHQDILFAPIDKRRSVLDHLERAVWEVGAWTSMILPNDLRQWLLERTRH